MSAITDSFFDKSYNKQAEEHIDYARELNEQEKEDSFLRAPLKYIFQLDQKKDYRFVFFPLASKIKGMITTGYEKYKTSEPDKNPGNLEYLITFLSADEFQIVSGDEPNKYFSDGKEMFVPESNVISNIRDACAIATRTLALSVMLAVVGSFELLKTIPLISIYSIGFAGFKLLSTIFSCSLRNQEEPTADEFEVIGASTDDLEEEESSPNFSFQSLPFSSTSYADEYTFESLPTEESGKKEASYLSLLRNFNPFSMQRKTIEQPELFLEESNHQLKEGIEENYFGEAKISPKDSSLDEGTLPSPNRWSTFFEPGQKELEKLLGQNVYY